MNKLGIYILSTFTTLVYVMGVVGVGVHTCQHSGKQRVVLLAHETCTCGHEQEKATTCAHEAESCCGAGCNAENHDGNTDDNNTDEGCCDVTYKALPAGSGQSAVSSMPYAASGVQYVLLTENCRLLAEEAAVVAAFGHSPPPFTPNTVPDIYRLSQLRL
jgi:hypothetical protein